jgi:hypothetical protein
MFKKVLLSAFGIGVLVTTILGIAFAQSSPPQAPGDGKSLVVRNASDSSLNFILETSAGEMSKLGAAAPGESVVVVDALTPDGPRAKLKSQEYRIHAKDQRGYEFFTLLIDQDEVVSRGGALQIPGYGGRPVLVEMLAHPTSPPPRTLLP